MAICMFRYVFNISFALPEDIGFNVYYKGNRSLVRVKTIHGANISSFTGEDYSWLLNKEENNGKLYTMRITINNNEFKKIPVRYIKFFKDKDLFSGGMIQLTNFSVFEVSFNIPNKKFLDKKENIDKLENASSEILNHFTNSYRLISQEEDIYLPKSSESPVIEIWFSDTVEKDGEFITADLKPYRNTVNFKGLNNPNKSVLSSEKIELINELLKNDNDIPLYQQLLLEAKEHGHIKNNYELSVLKIGTAFEVFLQEMLVNSCEILKIEQLPVGRGNNLEKLHTKYFKEAIQEGKIIEDLLKKYLKIVVGNNSILAGKEYNHWHTKAYILRNEIVHSGRTNVSDDEARMAFESTNLLISLISNKVNKLLLKCNT